MAKPINNKNEEFSSTLSSLSNHKNIINLLSKNSFGLTITEISKMLSISRNTVSVYLAKLEGAEKVRIRKIGMAKLYSLKPKLQTKLQTKEQD